MRAFVRRQCGMWIGRVCGVLGSGFGAGRGAHARELNVVWLMTLRLLRLFLASLLPYLSVSPFLTLSASLYLSCARFLSRALAPALSPSSSGAEAGTKGVRVRAHCQRAGLGQPFQPFLCREPTACCLKPLFLYEHMEMGGCLRGESEGRDLGLTLNPKPRV